MKLYLEILLWVATADLKDLICKKNLNEGWFTRHRTIIGSAEKFTNENKTLTTILFASFLVSPQSFDRLVGSGQVVTLRVRSFLVAIFFNSVIGVLKKDFKSYIKVNSNDNNKNKSLSRT